MPSTSDIQLRTATLEDLPAICKFVDFWLSGRGKRVNAPGAVDDYFVSPSQHKKYIKKYQVWLLFELHELIAWSVVQHGDSMIHFLIAGTHRGKGIGSTLLKMLTPTTIRSKSNQSSGDPGPFYEKHGYRKVESIQSKSRTDIDKLRPDRRKIIDIYQKPQQ
ncbi:hypothetical protein ES703_79576 [subsurface metagenome]